MPLQACTAPAQESRHGHTCIVTSAMTPTELTPALLRLAAAFATLFVAVVLTLRG